MKAHFYKKPLNEQEDDEDEETMKESLSCLCCYRSINKEHDDLSNFCCQPHLASVITTPCTNRLLFITNVTIPRLIKKLTTRSIRHPINKFIKIATM